VQPRARAVMLTNYCEVARFVGLDPFVMLGRAAIHPGALIDPENWIPGNDVLDLIDDSARRSERDDFGILLGQCRTFASLGPVALLLRHSATLGDAILAAIHYRHLLNELLEIDLRDDGRTAILEWNLIPGLRSTQGANLLAAIAYRVLVDGFDWEPECVHFRQAKPNWIATFAQLIQCSLDFESAFDGMSFMSECLELPNCHAEPELVVHAKRLLDLMPGIRHDDSILDRTRSTVAMMISSGSVHSQDVARCLGMPVRTLQRRLLADGHSFSSLLNEVRRDLAVRYLSSSNQSITAVAHLIGYSAIGSFTRWFVSEFGMSPIRWRKLMRKRDTLHL
jgi:AraC-like DNA-binding protein